MPYIPASDQDKKRKTPEELRAERIANVTDPSVRKEIAEIEATRDAKLAESREIQKGSYDKHVSQMRDQKIRSANGPQFTPPGMQPKPYLGTDGYKRAANDAKAEVTSRYNAALAAEGKLYNDKIDRKLDRYEQERAGEQSRSTEPGAPKLKKFEDRFPDDAKHEITR